MTTFIRPEQTPAWQVLHRLATEQPLSLPRLLADPSRARGLTLLAAGLQLDISRQRVNDAVLQALRQWAEQMQVMPRARDMFAGRLVNPTEGRAALHVALRGGGVPNPPWGDTVANQIRLELDRFLAFAEHARAGAWLGHDGQAITDVVNIGIGGSDLGPRMACHALGSGAKASPLRVHFVSNPDPQALESVLTGLQPARTGFIVQKIGRAHV